MEGLDGIITSCFHIFSGNKDVSIPVIRCSPYWDEGEIDIGHPEPFRLFRERFFSGEMIQVHIFWKIKNCSVRCFR